MGEKAPRASDLPWTLAVEGLVARPRVWTIEELLRLPRVERAIDIHCVTRWSRPAVTFSGVPLEVVLEASEPLSSPRFISFVARSDRSHSTSLTLADALELDVLLAFEADGAPLADIHGGPLRTVVPGRYFYKSLKWLERIDLLAEDRPGFWEGTAGYHNHADPWLEERYMAPDLDRRMLQRALQAQDFSGLDLRSVQAAGMDLRGLAARGALLRDSDFRGTNLEEADFSGANLSNAHAERANLRGAQFIGADVEGADFTGADLRGADFTRASLFGASFCPEDAPGEGAVIDATTRIDQASIEALTPGQAEYVSSRLQSPPS